MVAVPSFWVGDPIKVENAGAESVVTASLGPGYIHCKCPYPVLFSISYEGFCCARDSSCRAKPQRG